VIEDERNDLFEYFGLRTLYDAISCAIRSPRQVIETPQYFFMRVACGLAESSANIRVLSSALVVRIHGQFADVVNSGTRHPQILLLSARLAAQTISKRFTPLY